MRVAIVIVTFNSVRFIPDLFESLSRIDRTGLDVDLLVVDNASTDDTRALVAGQRGIRPLWMKENLGFAGGNNVGIREALEGGAEYVYLLNHDTIVEPGFLVEAVRAAEADKKAAAVQSLLLLHPDTQLVNSAGNAIHFLGLGYCLGYRTPADAARKDEVRAIAYASGAGVLLRADALRQVGLLDESFFMYHEDLDLGWRLRLAGWKNVIAPRSVVFHKYEFSRSIKKYFWMERNRWAVLFKNCRVWTLVVLAPWLLGAELGLFAISLVSGWWREKLRVYAAMFSADFWRHVRAERAKVAALRTVSDKEIFSMFTSVIAFQDVESSFTKYVANPLMTAVWSVIKHLIV